MAGVVRGDSSHQRIMENSPKSLSHDMHDKNDQIGSSWYLSRKDIEENSPSRKDGIDLKKEAYLRKSYCTFLQDLGMRLKVPQVTIATAIVFCHRFFLRQSHLKNDRRTIATVCMFLAGKVEETPRPLKDVILVSYEIIHKKDPAAVQRIKQREVYEQQKELILLGERVVLATLGFDFNVNHPYKPLVEAIKKFKVAQNALAQVAWNFVNDGLRTSLGLQFKPHHIAAGAIFLAAKFLKVKLPSDGDKVWWQELEVTPRQLEEVSNQMLELYEQNRVASQSHGNEAEGSSAGVASHLRTTSKSSAAFEEPTPQNGPFQTSSSSRPVPDQAHTDRQKTSQRIVQRDHNGKEVSDWHHDPSKFGETLISKSAYRTEHPPLEEPRVSETNEINSITADAMSKIDKDRVKAAMEKRKRSRTEFTKKTDLMDEDDLIERELESGIELAAEDERSSQDRKQSWYRTENGIHRTYKEMQNAEGEVSLVDKDFHAPDPMNRKRKEGYELPHQHTVSSKHQDLNDSWVINQSERGERDHKRAR